MIKRPNQSVKEIEEMGFWEDMERRAKRFSLLDMVLSQASGMFFGLFVAALIPQIMNLTTAWLFLALSVLSSSKPSCVFLFKK